MNEGSMDRTPAQVGFAKVLLFAAWFGIATGLVEAALVGSHGRLIQGFIYLSPHVLWMAPLANVLWFMVPGIVLGLIATRRSEGISPGLLLGVLASLAWLCLLFIPSKLHWSAALFLALGLGVQTGRILSKRFTWVDRVVRRTAGWMVAGVALLCVGVFVWLAIAERARRKQLGEGDSKAPNVVLIILDTVRKADLSLYGYSRPTTPLLERWAKRGVRFDHALATSAWTLPSHASMFTGRYPFEMSTGWMTGLDDTHPTLAEWLGGHGYHTAGFVANLIYCNADFGLARGFVHYEDYTVSPGELVINSSLGRKLTSFNLVRSLIGNHDILGRKTGQRITDDFLRWVDGTERTRPFFAFLNYFDAHQPFLPPPEFDRQFASATPRRYDVLEHRPHIGKVKEGRLNLTPADVQREQEAYDATLAYLDQQVSRLLEQLERDGILDNTIVVITADHGEQFMEHDLFGHGNSLYRFVTEVPLLVIYPPGMTPGRVVSQPVSIRDIPATVVDLTGTASGSPFPGRSLVGLPPADSLPGMMSVPVLSEVTLAGRPDTFRAVLADGMRSIWMHDSVRVYDFWTDSSEMHDLSGTPRGDAAVAKLRATLDSALGRPVVARNR